MAKNLRKPTRLKQAKASRPAARRTPVRGRKSPAAPTKPKRKRAMTEKTDHEKAAEKRDHDKRFDNPGQDPNHPTNKTLSPAPRTGAEPYTVPPAEMMTEQEKLAAGATGDATAGVGPVTPAEHTTGPVETIEDQGIGPRTPYPEGNPPAPDVETTRAQGIKGAPAKNAPDKPLVKEPHR